MLGEPTELRIVESSRRLEATDTDTGEHVPAPAPDQVAATGTLPNGVVASFHYRAGLSRGTNFRWEINGTDGDVVVTASTGHLQLAPITVTGARGDDQDLSPLPLPVPEQYVHVPGLDPVRDSPAYAVTHVHHQLLADLRARTSTVPDFDHAVRRHHSIEALDGRPGRCARPTPSRRLPGHGVGRRPASRTHAAGLRMIRGRDLCAQPSVRRRRRSRPAHAGPDPRRRAG